MKIAFFSNYLNHHQLPLVNALNAIPGVECTFVATEAVPEFRRKLGYKVCESPYLLDTTAGEEQLAEAGRLAVGADVAIFIANAMENFEIPRLKAGKLTFEVSERRFKKGLLNLLSPGLWKHQLMYWRYGRKAPLYMLCCSAFAAWDYEMLLSFRDRCYKWAYFTEVKTGERIENKTDRCRLMWCGRLIGWKHPELALKTAKMLKATGIGFDLDIFGEGPMKERIGEMVKKNGLEDCVKICGGTDNAGVRAEMLRHDVFLFTSDRNEGWGAVVGEAMSSGCAVIASDEAGAVPYLVKDGVNGLIFKSRDEESLFDAVYTLATSRKITLKLAGNAVRTMTELWNPEVAAARFVNLAQRLMQGKDTPYAKGPCSRA